MAISENILHAIEARVNIVDVVSAYVQLTSKGDRSWGLCPFHREKSPSFTVTPAKNMFYCFGCGKGGNIYRFLMEIENIPFMEAARRLAERAGIALEDESGMPDEDAAKRDALYTLYEKLTGFFEDRLARWEDGEAAQNYVVSRGFSQETIKAYHFGYAPAGPEHLYEFLIKRGYSPDFLAISGMFSKNYVKYALFRNRLIFPIRDERGRTVAFTARAIPPVSSDTPKYINSPETLIFSKKSLPYGIFQAKAAIASQKSFILCEGSADVCAMWQMGYKNAVAPLGSAFTHGQAQLLKRYASSALLLFDGDEAGQKAIAAAAIICEKEGIETKAAKMEGGKDPSEFLQKGEGALLQNMVNGARVAFDFLSTEALKRERPGDADGAERVCAALFPYLRVLISPVRKAAYIKLLADKLGLGEDVVRAEFERREGEPSPGRSAVRPESRFNSPDKGAGSTAAFELFFVFLSRPDLFLKYKNEVRNDYIEHADLALAYRYLSSAGSSSSLFNFIETQDASEGYKNFLLKRAANDALPTDEESAVAALKRLRMEEIGRSLSEMAAEVARAERDGLDRASVDDMYEEMAQMQREIRQIKEGD